MFFNKGKGMTLDYAMRLSVNAVAIVVGYRLWTNKPITTFDKITFTIGLLAIGFTVSAVSVLAEQKEMIIEGDY